MKVLEERLGGVKSGESLDVKGLGLPRPTSGPALIVFWKGK